MKTPTRQTDAGSVGPSSKRWVVTWTHDHESLKFGDVVVVGVTPKNENILIRESDMTLHAITDKHDQYVHLGEMD